MHMPMHKLCEDEMKTRNQNIESTIKSENIIINHYMGRYVRNHQMI
jgi:hypothetical protein